MKYRVLLDYGEGMSFLDEAVQKGGRAAADFGTVDAAVKAAFSSHAHSFYVVRIIDWKASDPDKGIE